MNHRRPRLRTRNGAALLCCWLLAAGAAGCGSAADERQAAGRSPAEDAEWRWLQQTRRTLAAQRTRLDAAAAGDPQLGRRSEALAAEFNRRLAELINADPPVQGKPLTARQQAAIGMKSDEDIRLARQFIAQGGDYQRAIAIYKEALVVDPGNPRLRQELAKARARRYMTRETFAQAKEGMDRDEVRRLLGQPNLHNVRDYTEREVVAWFYPKNESGAAAAVWFHADGADGANGANGDRYTVYQLDFNALQPHSPAEPAQPPDAARSST